VYAGFMQDIYTVKVCIVYAGFMHAIDMVLLEAPHASVAVHA
jgi:hypothetical protein